MWVSAPLGLPRATDCVGTYRSSTRTSAGRLQKEAREGRRAGEQRDSYSNDWNKISMKNTVFIEKSHVAPERFLSNPYVFQQLE
jgi:hypothetical protein